MNIIYRKFKENEIEEIDNLFSRSMQSASPNLLYSFYIIFNYYWKIICFSFFVNWFLGLNIEFYIFCFFCNLSFLLYVGVKLFLFFFVQQNFPSKNINTFLQPKNFIFVAYDSDKQKIVGFNSVKYLGNNSGWMDYHFVDPEYFNKGIGINLIIEIWDYCFLKKNNVLNNGLNDYLNVYGGTSSMQIGFWKKYATNITLQTNYNVFGYQINKKIIDFLPIKGYDIHFNYFDFQKKIKFKKINTINKK